MSATAVETNAYDVALENLDIAAAALGLEKDVCGMIKYPERILMVTPKVAFAIIPT